MKTLTTFCFCLIAAVAFAQESAKVRLHNTFGMDGNFMSPTSGMKQNIRAGFGGTASWLVEAPSRRVAGGLELNITGYGHSGSTVDYTFPDGTVAPMQMKVNNSYTSLMAVTRLYLLVDGPVRPYATVKAGYTFFRTELSIFDPDDGDSCEPLERNILSRDGTFAYSAGGGVRVDLAWLLHRVEKGMCYLDVSTSALQGGRVNYMNENPPAQSNNNSMHMGSSRVQDVNADFINTQTQVVHPHHVGYLYNSFLQMVDFRLGMSFTLGH